MEHGKTDLKDIIQKLNPIKNPGTYIYTKKNNSSAMIPFEDIIFYFRENEGSTLILDKSKADEQKLSYHQLFAWITLDVHTSLNAIGLTALISDALSRNKIPCNIVAAYTHDHLFVPEDLSEKTLRILNDLSKEQPTL